MHDASGIFSAERDIRRKWKFHRHFVKLLLLCLVNSKISADHELFDAFERFSDFRGKDALHLYSLKARSTHLIVPSPSTWQTSSRLQSTLPTILALAVNDDLNDTSDTYNSSSLSSNSSGRTPRDLIIRERIPLTISDWAIRASTEKPDCNIVLDWKDDC